MESLKLETARGYIKRFPKMKQAPLSRKMHQENSELFNDAEAARSSIRYAKGKHGTKDRTWETVKNSPELETKTNSSNPNEMPESWSVPKPPFKLPVGCNRIGFISDLQIPFHKNEAITGFVKWLKTREVNTIYLNGDIMDFYALSFFQKDPRKRKFRDELEAAKQFFAWLRWQFPDAQIYYNLDANHEKRWEKWLFNKAPELLDIHEFELDVVLQLNRWGIIPLRRHKYISIGKLETLHGDVLFGKWGTGINKARNVFNKCLKSTIVSHVHVTDEYTKRDLSGKLITCWTTGCFMDIDCVEYQEINDYNYGGAYIETDREGNFMVENRRMIGGKVI